MFVLLRKDHERIVIDGRIVVTVLSSKTGRARIGIEAPETVRIVRGEQLDDQGSPNQKERDSHG